MLEIQTGPTSAHPVRVRCAACLSGSERILLFPDVIGLYARLRLGLLR